MATHVRNEKKQIFLSVVVLIIAVFTIFGIFIVKSNPILSNYKKQSIVILNDYKNGKLEGKKASDKLDSLAKKLEKEYKENDNIGIMCLQSELSSLALKMKYEEISDSEIKNYIQEIKNIDL